MQLPLLKTLALPVLLSSCLASASLVSAAPVGLTDLEARNADPSPPHFTHAPPRPHRRSAEPASPAGI
jgi:hypothetical protein